MDLRNAVDWMKSKLMQQTRSEQILYTRGNDTIVLEYAVAGESTFQVSDFNHMRVNRTERDWIIDSNELILGGSKTEPLMGDRIIWQNGTVTNVYKVTAQSGDKVFHYSDPFQKMMRIH